jgi:outer membrane cobalamin receptor
MRLDRRSKFVVLACATAFLVSAMARADAPTPKPVTATVETNATTNAPNSVKGEGLKGKVIVTGSNIPQDVKRIGRTTDAISPVLVIDQQDIQRSGAATVGDVLKRLPFATTGPGR